MLPTNTLSTVARHENIRRNCQSVVFDSACESKIGLRIITNTTNENARIKIKTNVAITAVFETRNRSLPYVRKTVVQCQIRPVGRCVQKVD